MADTKTWYRPGLVFKAGRNESCHQEICRSKHDVKAVDGTVIDTIPELLAEFGVYGEEFSYVDPDGLTNIAADIRGGWFDLDAQADEKGWGQDEREIVARHMLRLAEDPRRWSAFTLYSRPAAPKPWPTIDTAHAKQIPPLAAQLGLSAEALLWVRENKPNWTECATLLEEQIAASRQEAVVEEQLTAA